MHFRARSYDSRLGRFIQRDPDPRTRGRQQYSYVANQPTRFTDPSGMYQVDLHFYLTYYLASRNGFDAESSFMLAGATQYTDNSERTEPFMNVVKGNVHRVAFLHFAQHQYRAKVYNQDLGRVSVMLWHPVKRNTSLANRTFDHAFGESNRERALTIAGIGLHTLMDSYSHEGFNFMDNQTGHAAHNLLGVTPDNPNLSEGNRKKALEMAKRVNARLKELARHLGQAGANFGDAELETKVGALFNTTEYQTTGSVEEYDKEGIWSFGQNQVTKRWSTKHEWVREKMWQDFIRKELGRDVDWNGSGLKRYRDKYDGVFNDAVTELFDHYKE